MVVMSKLHLQPQGMETRPQMAPGSEGQERWNLPVSMRDMKLHL